ncbi:isotrichodermin C-15 hydroxylase [Diaporthe helianthi]|uniref:Isotrichodermin C-15 hydroxylase n=1 Tax=Diaporthe helianthi TaxID=158607 RepID=A0A2P5HVM8_DIAHE|nr:isotrichodermin C-15 hydroxylase [Diaporthe helianthi]
MRLVLGGVLCFTLWISSLVVYRLFFHPLARIPGPLIQRISGVPRIWQCYIGNRYLCEMRAHDKYGSVVRTGPNSVVFNTLSSLQALHVKSANVFKGDEFYGLLDGGPAGGKSLQMIADNEAHSARRRLLAKALPPRDQVFQDINELSQNFVDIMEEESGTNSGIVDVSKVTSWYSFDVISTIAFGQAFDMMHTNTWRWLPLCLQQMSVFLYAAGFASGHVPLLRFFQWLLRTNWPSRLGWTTALQAQNYADLAAERVHDRGERLKSEGDSAESGRKDIFGHLMRAKFHDSADLASESSLLIAAGSDAVRFAVAATMFYLLQNADAMEKVTAEVRSLELGEHGLDEAKMASLKYLRACIDEGMRLSPPKAGSIPRETGAGGIVIEGVLIPEGMSVGTSTYALHRDPEIYKQPYEYKPERWLERPHDPRLYAAFTPFMKGPRACPGKAIAYVAMQCVLFHMLRELDVESTTDRSKCTERVEVGSRSWRYEDDFPFNDWIIGYTKGPFVRVTRP